MSIAVKNSYFSITQRKKEIDLVEINVMECHFVVYECTSST